MLSSLLLPVSALAGDWVPAKSYQQVLNGKRVTDELTEVARVPTARVLIADYDLIRKDFRKTRTMTEAQIDEWLLKNAGFISKTQIDIGPSRKTNTAISADLTDRKKVLRPRDYNRALVFAVDDAVIDLKGAGAPDPYRLTHRNGLMETAEAIREYAFTKNVKEILKREKSKMTVVDTYAVFDWGFQQSGLEDNLQSRSGAVLRQGHVRDLVGQGQLSDALTEATERTLRKYGVSSAASVYHLGRMYDVLNVQGTADGKALFDFGSYRVQDKFDRDAITIVDYAENYRGRSKFPDEVIFDADLKESYPQIEPEKAMNYEAWNGAGHKAAEEKIWIQSRELAEKLNTRPIAEVRQELNEYLQKISLAPSSETLSRAAGLSTCLGTMKSWFGHPQKSAWKSTSVGR